MVAVPDGSCASVFWNGFGAGLVEVGLSQGVVWILSDCPGESGDRFGEAKLPVRKAAIPRLRLAGRSVGSARTACRKSGRAPA